MATRRDFLQTAGVIGAGLIAGELVGGNMVDATSAAPSIVMMDGMDLSKAIHSKTVSCREVITAYLDHIARINPKVNAIVSLQDRDGLQDETVGIEEPEHAGRASLGARRRRRPVLSRLPRQRREQRCSLASRRECRGRERRARREPEEEDFAALESD